MHYIALNLNPTPPQAASACNTGTTQTQPHLISNTQRTENKTTDVVIQQHSRKLLMMDILMSETCWIQKKWNKIASDIKLVFYEYSSNLILSDMCFIGGPFHSGFPTYIRAHLLFLPYLLRHESNSYCELALVHLTRSASPPQRSQEHVFSYWRL